METTYGRHLLLDIWIKEEIPTIGKLRDIIVMCAVATGATIMTETSFQFSPDGISIVLVLAESHLSVHAWTTERFMSIDCYTCGNQCDPMKILTILESYFTIEDKNQELIERGM